MRMWSRLIATAIIGGTIALGTAPAAAHIPDDCIDAYNALDEQRKILRDPLDLYWMLEDEGMLYSIDHELLLKRIIEPTFVLDSAIFIFTGCLGNHLSAPPSPKEGHEAYELLACHEAAKRMEDAVIAVTSASAHADIHAERDEAGSITFLAHGPEGYKTPTERYDDLKNSIDSLFDENQTLMQCILASQSALSSAE